MGTRLLDGSIRDVARRAAIRSGILGLLNVLTALFSYSGNTVIPQMGVQLLLFSIETLVMATFAIAFLGIPICLLLLVSKRLRPKYFRALLACLIAFIVVFPAFFIGWNIRMKAMEKVSGRSQPIIEAIHAFKKGNNRWPSTLDDLVPEFLADVPHTGLAAYPDYTYHSRTEGNEYIFNREYNNPWVLVIYVIHGFNFDKMLYFPDQDYPERGYGGWLERMGDWAYVHE